MANDKENLEIKKKPQKVSEKELDKVAGGGSWCDSGASWKWCS